MKPALSLITIATLFFMLEAPPASGLDPSLDMNQYAHTAWTSRDGFSMGAIFSIAQTPDGYLWLASEFGLYRFDGVRAVRWQAPAGQQMPDKPYALLVGRDGTLWIGTELGLVSWDGSRLTHYPELDHKFVTSLLEDREGTVWAGLIVDSLGTPPGRLCTVRRAQVLCYGQDGSFGSFVWSLSEDSSGNLWAGAESGVWRWKPGPPRHYAMPGVRVGDMVSSPNSLLVGISGGGITSFEADQFKPYPIYSPTKSSALLPDGEIDSNKLLRDRDGGLWIGTHQRGLIHIHNGRTDVFTKSDGLSGDISCSLFEDREGNVWYGSSRGLDRFRELPVTTISTKEGLSSDYPSSLVAGADGSVWIGTHDGLNRWKDGKATVFHKSNGLPDEFVHSLFEDHRGRLWATFRGHGLSYFENGRFVSVPGLPSEEIYSITGDDSDNVWLSGNKGLSHVRAGRFVENIPWSVLGRHQQAKVLVPDGGGVWLAFWIDGGVLYFKDGKVQASFTTANGLGAGEVAGLQRDGDGALWAATQHGGISRIKDGRFETLSMRNGLPCDTVHWSIEDNDRSLWINASCGLARITRSELQAWIFDPNRRVAMTVWDAADGVKVVSGSPAYYNPPVAKATDGRLWFQSGDSIQVIDPHHLVTNGLPPPVHIEQVVADDKLQWRNLAGAAPSNLRLPARTRDLDVHYVGLSFVAPEKMQFRIKLEGQDDDWKVPVNPRHAHYTNLGPGNYRFRVIAANNSGVWNEQGDMLEFSIDPAYYQTNWFRALCAAGMLLLLWGGYQLRIQQMQREFNTAMEARVSERTRIARDLHDTLLQSLQALLFQYQAARNLFAAKSERALPLLDATIDRTEQAIAESRDAIRDIRSENIAQNDLAESLTLAGSELAESQAEHGSPTFGVTVEGERRVLSPISREEIYRMALELLRNAFRHANARRIETEIRYDKDMLRLRIRDNGKGMDLKSAQEGSSGHWGLRGVRERAEQIGAQLDLWSEVGVGTEFQLTVPAAIAYGGANDKLPFRLLRKVREYAHRD